MARQRRQSRVATLVTMHEKRKKLNPQEDQAVLCACCIKMTTTRGGSCSLSSPTGYKHHNREALAINARLGCPFCFWAYSQLRHVWKGDSPGRLHVFIFEPGGVKTTIWNARTIWARVCYNGAQIGISIIPSVYFKISRHPPSFKTARALQAFLRDAQTKSTDMASPKAMQRAKQLLKQCQEKHGSCHSVRDSLLPTRIIDVGCDGDSFIKLHISEPWERGQYLALNYCWGGPQQYTTTQKTIAKTCEGILLKKLPKTIQDAVNVTRQLGFQFLWIDALCILQDSEMDKHREIGHMGAVYKNAILTIVASTALAVSDGFLYNIPMMRSFYVPVHMNNGEFVGLQFSLVGPADPPQSTENSLIYGKQPEPLDRRGWALQESLLSRRTLTYGSKEMLWRCQSDVVTKSPNGIKTSRPLPPKIFNTATTEQETNLEKQQISIWDSIVEDYSGREFSLPTDRMPAISGIVGELASYWDDTYVAGMWERLLAHSLAWRAIRSSVGKLPDMIQSGPSWSWVSYLSKVSFVPINIIAARWVDWTVQFLNSDAPFSNVVSGTLKIQAVSRTLNIFCQAVFDAKNERRHVNIEFYFDDGSTYNISDVQERHGTEKLQLLLLGVSGVKGAGLILEDVGNGTWKRPGLWTWSIPRGYGYSIFRLIGRNEECFSIV